MKPLGPFDEPIPAESLKQVAAIVPRMEVRDIRLVGLSAALKGTPLTKARTIVDLDHRVEAERVLEGTGYVTRVHFKLAASSASESTHEYLSLKAVFQLWYSVGTPDTAKNDQLQSFAEINAVHTIWPYFRELVQNVTARMGVAPMTVPLLKLARTETPESKDESAPSPSRTRATIRRSQPQKTAERTSRKKR